MATTTQHALGELDFNEELWVEIIRTMEDMYATLAKAQTEMERRAAELVEANEFISNVVQSIVNGLVVTDAEGRITMANETCLSVMGYDGAELVGQPLHVLFPPGSERSEIALYPGTPRWRQLLSTGTLRGLETEMRTKAGQAVPVNMNVSVMRDRAGEAIGVVLVATDLREIKRLLQNARAEAEKLDKAYRELKALQARLIQSEKMSSLGRMAASVAHEINNPLGGVLIYSHLLLEDLPESSPHSQTLKKIVRETTRCKEIVRGLLGFARREQQSGRREIDLNAIVSLVLDMLHVHPSFREVERALDLSPTPLTIEGEEGPLQQAFMNVLVNAAEAMNGVGRVTIRSWADPSTRIVNVSIADTGPGIPAEHVDQLFEPFFTTKQVGHGTGLGLAIVYSVVRQHGGAVAVESKVGVGSTFTLSFPAQGAEKALP
jgi:two-component system, NtrC family, sensor kinase